ncbi:hypothetical protein GCM10010841_22320 [Deinococcus aerophilus]|uniref:Response regulatory domain-containing protein n=1 Tax=Deinococcus aerophilus TaxID=522488 RepID=A0ABQ2GV23_9DEIO|nr:hypothetical protein GCM10010841_22320 [Deinococcus aerophilus]
MSRVVIIENDELVRTIYRTLVEDTPGFQVVSSVGTLAQAERDLRHLQVNLLMVDIYCRPAMV